ncbi:hypothetical protein LJ739_10025 [Aestuariibacter halophilus]|uniref:Glutamate--cysteine ligase n=1 Tax=Fluctibacter halophilus TaxID=226011 RepID=A0ABS8G825_9ALTE|nr:glutamate--cysteine ligase [Aestuariibacter halophilus]MCC2616578.1 hypothetical protein [Aestuariibacter halophilus]
MGQNFDRDTFSEAERQQFNGRLQAQLAALEDAMQHPQCSADTVSLGAELEMYLVDDNLLPMPVNQEILNHMAHPQLQEELNRFNLEYNLSPVSATGTPFQAMQDELSPIMTRISDYAASINTQIVPIGILPTLKPIHLERRFMSDKPRYRALTRELRVLRGGPFAIHIRGEDYINMHSDEVTLEGANTSFQVHLRVPRQHFVAQYNAAQLVTPLALAVAGNSPLFLGKRLWQETRIALFKQSIDHRARGLSEWRHPARVCFGHGWMRHSPVEQFAESVNLYPPILPYLSSSDRDDFAELNLHHGTIWRWNRAIFDAQHGPHLRIEYRALPAGPTNIDMMANAAFIIGLTIALSQRIDAAIQALPFNYAEYNFYRAAQHGLDAELIWPQVGQHHPQTRKARDIVQTLLGDAADGLSSIGVVRSEVDRLMQVIEQRVANGQTGAQWQLRTLAGYNQTFDDEQSLKLMLTDYVRHCRSGEPVSTWR